MFNLFKLAYTKKYKEGHKFYCDGICYTSSNKIYKPLKRLPNNKYNLYLFYNTFHKQQITPSIFFLIRLPQQI